MNHYITSDNKTWGFDNTQTNLIPAGSVEIPATYTFDQYPYLTLVNGEISYNQTKHDADVTAQQATQQAQATAKASATAKLTALGLTADEITALIG